MYAVYELISILPTLAVHSLLIFSFVLAFKIFICAQKVRNIQFSTYALYILHELSIHYLQSFSYVLHCLIVKLAT